MSKPQVPNIYTKTIAKPPVAPLNSNTSPQLQAEDHRIIKTSMYPTQTQLDKLDDLAAEYNKLYRRQRKKIDRQDIIRYLIEQCDLETLADLDI
jgi:hypothetical protein